MNPEGSLKPPKEKTRLQDRYSCRHGFRLPFNMRRVGSKYPPYSIRSSPRRDRLFRLPIARVQITPASIPHKDKIFRHTRLRRYNLPRPECRAFAVFIL